MSPVGAHSNQTEPQQDWVMYPVADDAQRDDSADLDDNQDVFEVPEEIPDNNSEPESLPVPAAAAEGEEIPRDEFKLPISTNAWFMGQAWSDTYSFERDILGKKLQILLPEKGKRGINYR
uniref:Uncharacterized protein n=1 Tax=Sphaerodactylus townsendi TaxID=933632 RepID=A0ACB8FC62_9SAUR